MKRLLASTLGAVSILTIGSVAYATTYPVGASRAHHSVCMLLADGAVTIAPGDVIEVDPGRYTDACQVHPSGTASAPITLRGVPGGPRPIFDATGLDLSGSGSVPRAILQYTGAAFWVVEHLEFEHASNGSNNGSAFRVTAGGHDITYRDVSIHDCQDGAQSDGPVSIVIENSEIFHNGAGDGQSHNLYLAGDSVRIQGCYIHDSVGGQNVKLRVHDILLIGNLIANEGNYAIDFEQAGNTNSANANAVMIGNVLVRNPAAANHSQTIVFGNDNPSGTDVRNGNLYAINNTFVMTEMHNRLLNMLNPTPGSQAFFYNNIIHTTVAGTGLAFNAATDARIHGSNNWITTGVTAATGFTGNVMGAAPGFVSGTDFHLSAGAPVIDQGLAMPMYTDGTGTMRDGTPTLEYAAPLGTTTRAMVGALDLGAFEFGTPVASDAGLVDASDTDANASEAGVPDVTRVDAAASDVVQVDSAIARDGASGADAQADGGTGTTHAGCGCAVPHGSGHARGVATAMLVAGCFMITRRRRSARIH